MVKAPGQVSTCVGRCLGQAGQQGSSCNTRQADSVQGLVRAVIQPHGVCRTPNLRGVTRPQTTLPLLHPLALLRTLAFRRRACELALPAEGMPVAAALPSTAGPTSCTAGRVEAIERTIEEREASEEAAGNLDALHQRQVGGCQSIWVVGPSIPRGTLPFWVAGCAGRGSLNDDIVAAAAAGLGGKPAWAAFPTVSYSQS